MFQQLSEQKPSFVFSLRTGILSIFIGLFLVVFATILSIFYVHMYATVERAAHLLMKEVSYALLNELNAQLRPEELVSQFTAKNIQHHVLNTANHKETIAYFVHLLKELPLSQGVYWGDVQGNFTYVRKEPNGHFVAEIIDRRTLPVTDVHLYLDAKHHELEQLTVPVDFDPRERNWFHDALHKKQTIWTDAHLFQHGRPVLGITVASPAFSEEGAPLGVVGIDVSLAHLAQFVQALRVGEKGKIAVMNQQGRVIVASHPLPVSQTPAQVPGQRLLDVGLHMLALHGAEHEVRFVGKEPGPWFKAAYDTYQRNGQAVFNFTLLGKRYLASVKDIPLLAEHSWKIVIVDAENDFTNKINKLGMSYVFINMFIFLFGIVLLSSLVSRIVKPVKKLVYETEQMKNFHLEETSKISSHIREVIELSDAIYSMKMGLRSFQRYVPAGLVRQLITMGEEVQVGGKKRELAVFFSDIKDFTYVAEATDSDQLVKQVSEYFEAFSRLIIQNEGTLDKYIGDAIMAFWGAPRKTEAPCHHAARAALACMAHCDALNDKWDKENKPRFVTRIGIHFGEAIVGNLGSSERLSYTALGDTVNIASRLVNLNKLYGTSILVSGRVYQQIKSEFILRLVDYVVLRGRTESTALYELLGETKGEVTFDVEAYQDAFDCGFLAYQHQQWQDAIIHFKVCLAHFPQDQLAMVFIERCENFMETPPGANWTGIWYLYEK